MYFDKSGIQTVDKRIFASGEELTDVVSLHLPSLNQSYSQNLEISAIDLQNTWGLCLFLRIDSETKAIYHCSCTVPKSKISTINLEANEQDSTAVYWVTVSSWDVKHVYNHRSVNLQSLACQCTIITIISLLVLRKILSGVGDHLPPLEEEKTHHPPAPPTPRCQLFMTSNCPSRTQTYTPTVSLVAVQLPNVETLERAPNPLPPLWQTNKVLHSWVLFRDTTVLPMLFKSSGCGYTWKKYSS